MRLEQITSTENTAGTAANSWSVPVFHLPLTPRHGAAAPPATPQRNYRSAVSHAEAAVRWRDSFTQSAIKRLGREAVIQKKNDMLTVMHRHNDGTETIYEVKAVTRENPGPDAAIPALGDVVLRGVTCEPEKDEHFVGYPGACWEGNATLRISEKYFTKDGFNNARVFVMNRHGATVASHCLGSPL